MKRLGILLCASVALIVTSCSSNEGSDETTETAEAVTYTLDQAASSLEWAANMGPEYGHNGTVSIAEGSITMEGETLTGGSFVIDMNTIKNNDLEDPKAQYLEAHLMGTAPDEKHPVDLFFNTPKFPTVTVTLGEYNEGLLTLTLDILGKELTQKVPVVISNEENGASIKGNFNIDFNSLDIPGLQPNPEDGSQINPAIDFKLNVSLSK